MTPQTILPLITLPLEDPILKFMLIMAIVLPGAPLLLNRLKIPYLLGLIIAGAVIGPNGFNLVLRDSSIILSGTAGLLYIMFGSRGSRWTWPTSGATAGAASYSGSTPSRYPCCSASWRAIIF